MRRRHKKPRGFESVRQHFGCDGTGLVMVGDRYLTDVTFGNLHGMLTVHTEQLTTVGDNRVAQQMRRIEDWLVARYVRRGYVAPPHPPHELTCSLAYSAKRVNLGFDGC